MEKTEAILIARHPLTETSLIVRWCSAEWGLFKTVAKGALRPKSSFAGRLDLFVTCEAAFVRARSSDLHVLREAQLTEARLGLRTSYPRVLAATYFCKLMEMVAERETPLEELHELLRLSLDYLTTHEPGEVLVRRFERRLCELLGLGAEERDGAAQLAAMFQRELPPQREILLQLLQRDENKESAMSGSDIA